MTQVTNLLEAGKLSFEDAFLLGEKVNINFLLANKMYDLRKKANAAHRAGNYRAHAEHARELAKELVKIEPRLALEAYTNLLRFWNQVVIGTGDSQSVELHRIRIDIEKELNALNKQIERGR